MHSLEFDGLVNMGSPIYTQSRIQYGYRRPDLSSGGTSPVCSRWIQPKNRLTQLTPCPPFSGQIRQKAIPYRQIDYGPLFTPAASKRIPLTNFCHNFGSSG